MTQYVGKKMNDAIAEFVSITDKDIISDYIDLVLAMEIEGYELYNQYLRDYPDKINALKMFDIAIAPFERNFDGASFRHAIRDYLVKASRTIKAPCVA
jgi:hypothetical protein